ncbi:hypothetical protein F7725_004410 [Dissostichus mawsoni]|uniref:Uncharacterized protein n=1 Tax=Dissostichus mawsoni TaxID=36200 RepID=A0A7J5XIM2_DISMA|nr:hypothetical protein F7725_004410 [Dissostichus mawsoni]
METDEFSLLKHAGRRGGGEKEKLVGGDKRERKQRKLEEREEREERRGVEQMGGRKERISLRAQVRD